MGNQVVEKSNFLYSMQTLVNKNRKQNERFSVLILDTQKVVDSKNITDKLIKVMRKAREEANDQTITAIKEELAKLEKGSTK